MPEEVIFAIAYIDTLLGEHGPSAIRFRTLRRLTSEWNKVREFIETGQEDGR